MSSVTTKVRNPWLINTNPRPEAAVRLFCFPYAGGTTAIFHKWPQELPAWVDVCAVQLPGHGSRLGEAPVTDLFTLVEMIEPALLPYLAQPFAFFGHSMGAMISFELARTLRHKHGLQPLHLFVSGRSAPQLPVEETTYNLPEPEFAEELRRLNGTPPEVLLHAELMKLMLPILRADFELVQTYLYKPHPPLDCPITAFGGWEDNNVSRASLEAWREQTTSDFSVRMLLGDHFFLHSARPYILNVLKKELHAHVS
jgi:medium-chain acyl-[acyl-carrier-protein] hydrolase